MDSSSSDHFGNSTNHMLKQVEVMIAKEAIYVPKSENLMCYCIDGDEKDTSISSLPLGTKTIAPPPPSPISVLDTTSVYETHHPKKKHKSQRGGEGGKEGTIGRLTPDIHREVSQWMYKVIDHYSFDRSIVAIGMNFFVRYVSNPVAIDNNELSFELSTATSLYIAIKLFGGPKITRYGSDRQLLYCFAQMSSSRFDEKSIVQMEMKMLNAFSWHVHPSIPQHYVPYFVEKLKHDDALNMRATSALIDLSNYILELVVFNYELSYFNPSSLACAAIAIARRGLNTSSIGAVDTQEANQFKYLQPLLSNGLLSLNVIRETMDHLDLYLEEISPMLDDTDLGTDITGVLFKRSLSRTS